MFEELKELSITQPVQPKGNIITMVKDKNGVDVEKNKLDNFQKLIITERIKTLLARRKVSSWP